MRGRWLTLLLLIALASPDARGQIAQPPNVDRSVVLQVSLAGTQREFRIGETIPLQLAFSSAVENRYEINMAGYDRSGRMEYERFMVAPADGVVDPLENRRSGIMGGIFTSKFLSAEPTTIQLNLNEWVRFTRPGEYQLKVHRMQFILSHACDKCGESSFLLEVPGDIL